MPVEPIPCAPEPEPGCCAPSVSATPLCREDGSHIFLVVRSGCAECGQDGGDPEVAGWLDAAGAFTAGPAPADAGPCDTPCESPTTPAATLGLCLADGTPIAVIVTRDCAGTVTQTGWLNLSTGAWSAGQPPAGTIACGDARSIQVSGTFCDIDGDGEVVGLVLVEYTYDDQGAIEAVRLVDATTGDTYVPQGEVTVCPAGVEQPERDLVQLCDTAGDGAVTEFVRDYARDENGQITGHTDYLLDGTPYTPAGTIGVCQEEPCASTVSTLRLCDLNPDVEPNEDGQRCAVPFLRHLVHDCTGTVTEVRDTTPDGVTPYTAVEPVDCGDGIPALVEVPWEVVGIDPDPDSPAGRGFLYRLSPVDDPDTVGVVRVTTTTTANTSCAGTPPDYVFGNPCTYVFEPDAVLQAAATYVRVDLLDFDTFEPVTNFSPMPDRIGGTAYWDGTTLRPTVSNGTGEMYYDGPPASWTYRIGNTGGGTSCSRLSFAAVSLRREGCCAGCGDTSAEPCRDSSTTLLCDVAALDTITVLDTTGVQDDDGWQITSFTSGGCTTLNAPDGPVPGPAVWSDGYLSVRADRSLGGNCEAWAGYDTAPVRWVITKTFAAAEDGMAVISADGFRVDGGGRVRVNGQDVGLYGQWNQPSVGGSSQVPVTAGPNVIEIEVRDSGGPTWVAGRLDVVMTRTVQFMRRTVVDCETGETVSVTDTTLDGEPYEVTGEVGQCATVTECCEPAPPEARLDVETHLLCVQDTASGDVLEQVIAERVYDDQSGDLLEQRVTDLDGQPYELPAGAELVRCPSPDRITRQVCVVETGTSEFLTNAANATSGQDTDWVWAPTIAGAWYPMYRVAPNAAWTVTDTAPNPARWVSPHQSRSVCSPNVANSPNVTGTWFTRASWNLPANVDPDTIRIAATVLNADNKVEQWRLNDGPWQPVAGGTLAPPAWTFPPTAVPGGRAGQNEIIVQVTETQPAVTCPSANEAGMMLHVVATYDYEPRVWTQVIEPGGQTYYLDEHGDRQDSIPAGHRLVACGGGGETPCCPAVNTEPVTLCDVQDDGSSVTFLRHLTYTEGAEAPAVRDTLLDGTPYTPTGDVGTCPGAGMVACGLDPEDPDSGITGTFTTGEDVDPFEVFPVQPDQLSQQPSTGLAASLGGASTVIPPWTKTANCGATSQANGWQAVRLPAVPRPACDDGTVTVRMAYDLRNDGPAAATGGWLAARLVSVSGGVETVHDLQGGGTAPGVGVTRHITHTATIPAAILEAGDLYWDIRIETRQSGCKGWTVSGVSAEYEFGVAGCVSPPQMAQLVKLCEPVTVAPATDPRVDVESDLMCMLDGDGMTLGQVLVERVYDDQTGERTAQRLVDPTTGSPVDLPDGATLGTCPELRVYDPVQFCFSSTDTVERPGRVYEVDVPVAQGFGIEAILVDLIEYLAPVTWGVNDPTGVQFASDLRAATQARFPGATVTVTPPAISTTCGDPELFHVRIECLDLEDVPPSLVQYRYNAGQDLIRNAAFLTTPPTSNPSSGPHQLKRADNGGTLNCTSTANRGWETNDINGAFEWWGWANNPPGISSLNAGKATTPTPRATPVQEINAYGSGGGQPDTIWQTFAVPIAGTFNIRVVVGGRTGTENITIKLSTGDVNAAGSGDIINTVVAAGQVTNEGGAIPGPWTTYTNSVVLNPGVYTLAFTGPPVPGGASGGLFTDMRVYQDLPGALVSFTTDDDECTVTAQVTSTVCQWWAPLVNGAEVTAWQRLDTGEILSNVEFWDQVPAPSCCATDAAGGGSVTAGNLADSYPVCAVVEGQTLTVQRVVITDQSGGLLVEQFVGPDGASVVPTSWTPGECPPAVEAETRLDVETQLLCVRDTASGEILAQVIAERVYDDQDGELLEQRLTDLDGLPYVLPAGTEVTPCASLAVNVSTVPLCDTAGDGTVTEFLRHLTYTDGVPEAADTLLDGTTPYTPTGTVGVCAAPVCEVQAVIEACRCDDTDGDGLADTDYVELLGVDCQGELTSLGTYLPDLSAPYVPVAPVDCAETDQGAEPAHGVQARRVELAPGQTWTAAAWPTLQSVTAVAHGGTGTVTTDDGASTLYPSEAATWSVGRDTDALLAGPLAIAATSGTVTVTFTVGVAV